MGSKKTFDTPTKKDIDQQKTLLELTDTLQKELKKKDERFKDIPTPVNFAKLETDVKHHDRIIYGLLIVLLVASVGGYLHFDNKITAVSNRVAAEIKDLDKTHSQLEEKIRDETKAVNSRIDSIIIQNNKSLNATVIEPSKDQKKKSDN